LTIRNGFAGFYNSRSNLEVGNPALFEYGAVTTFGLDFEALGVEEMIRLKT